MLSAVVVLAAVSSVPVELYSYLNRPDSSFSYSSLPNQRYEMVSQTWQGIQLRHTISIVWPVKVSSRNTAVLVIQGGKVNDADQALAKEVADKTGLPIVTLYDIPNQPLYGQTEDGLIAHTFQKYLETGDPTWPLLFPMAKSAIRAMDVVQKATASASNPINRFIVTGASKRGWTSWFVGASRDKRVIGIAPLVIDNLNIPAQMKHQIASWGAYSEEIVDYTSRGLQDLLETEKGKKLAEIVDPYSYRTSIKAPTLIVNGANDPYWTVDALNLYWDGLKQPKWVVYIPNQGHDASYSTDGLKAIGAFACMVASGKRWPALQWKLRGSTLSMSFGSQTLGARLWVAESDTLDFRESVWKVARSVALPSASYSLAVPASARNQAYFGQVLVASPVGAVGICTPMQVRKTQSKEALKGRSQQSLRVELPFASKSAQ